MSTVNWETIKEHTLDLGVKLAINLQGQDREIFLSIDISHVFQSVFGEFLLYNWFYYMFWDFRFKVHVVYGKPPNCDILPIEINYALYEFKS